MKKRHLWDVISKADEDMLNEQKVLTFVKGNHKHYVPEGLPRYDDDVDVRDDDDNERRS